MMQQFVTLTWNLTSGWCLFLTDGAVWLQVELITPVSTSVSQCDTPEEVQPLLNWSVSPVTEEMKPSRVRFSVEQHCTPNYIQKSVFFYISLSIITPNTNIITEIWSISFTNKIGIHHHHRHHPQLHQRALTSPAGEETAEVEET